MLNYLLSSKMQQGIDEKMYSNYELVWLNNNCIIFQAEFLAIKKSAIEDFEYYIYHMLGDPQISQFIYC